LRHVKIYPDRALTEAEGREMADLEISVEREKSGTKEGAANETNQRNYMPGNGIEPSRSFSSAGF
jgi:hypothetical protein